MIHKVANILAGDLGGTKTDLAIFSSEAGLEAPLAEATFLSADFPDLEALVRTFLAQVNVKIERASFGVAGPVVGGQATITNLPWVIDEAQLRETLGLLSVHLLNDLVAVAEAVLFLEPNDLYTLNEGEPTKGGAIAVVAPGTGLGEAYLTWDGKRYRTHASEGGHADFAPGDQLEMDLLRHLQSRFGHVSTERLCSGKGIPNIYAFLKESGYAIEPSWMAEQLSMAADPTPVIVNAALDNQHRCELCTATLNIFTSILGREVGNVALRLLATGGVYLGGGIPPRILAALKNGQFMEAFLYKGRLSYVLKRVPIYVILNRNAAVLGAACYGFKLAESGC